MGGIPPLTSLPYTARRTTAMTPKFRTRDLNVRDSKRKDKATTLARREIRTQKYESNPAVNRIAASA
ncbi:hypothetical protein SEA_HANK144_73 [Streptomyces phage Hank144]|uniref:Uncharacterized protein n=1 Tax=Streptomyces phage Hank144 TaxID=2301573 RepID=A0A385DP47_9CAUD|nr:hypothetical protein KGG76_gp73 [Streptomyces phage Hank144]AXQ61126.1 hypothetical protein SEA_HANK144_73 [Streptomyces phage Hank144]